MTKYKGQIWLVFSALVGATISLSSNKKVSVNLTNKRSSDLPPEAKQCTCVQYYLCNDNITIGSAVVDAIDIANNYQVCTNYLHTCCAKDKVRPVNDPILPKPQPLKINSSCGNRNIEGIDLRLSKLYNKEDTKYGEFPWMVAIIRQQDKSADVYQCGGSLIHPRMVLTVAHCVWKNDNLIIHAGEWDTQTKDELYPTQDRKVSEIIVHKQYNSKTLANDIALLILESPVDMTLDNVGLICLPEPGYKMGGQDCIVSGWGKDLYGKEGRYSVILEHETVTVVLQAQCQEALRKTRLGSRFTLHTSFNCAEGPDNKCKGEGGSPLVCSSPQNPDVYVQGGIFAWGISCKKETPMAYVNVPYFVNWINDNMKAKNISQ